MIWKVADAKQRFSEMLRSSTEEPQIIQRRDRAVAAVIGIEEFERYSQWRRQQEQRSLEDEFAVLRQICREEDYVLELPDRTDRPNAMLAVLEDEPE